MQATEDTDSDVSLPTKTIDYDASVEERLTDNAVENILPARYLDKDSEGNVTETPAELFERVAQNVAQAEDEADVEFWADEFEEQMKTLKFMPNSPTLMNAGLDMQQLSACFVLEPQDDMGDILDKVKDAGLIFKSGGGVGYTFSHLRPNGTIVQSTKGQSSGPVSFMQLFNEVCSQVEQGGNRRGAQMGIMRIDHPDIVRFITAKREEGELANFNISVALTDEFLDALDTSDNYTLKFEDEPFEAIEASRQQYHPDFEELDGNVWQYADTIVSTNGETLRERWEDADWDALLSGDLELPSQFIWDIIVDGAWRNGEPGLFHLDETNRQHSFGDLDGDNSDYKINATNPCAEQPLCNYEACNLGHVNLSLMKKEDAPTFDEYDGGVESYMYDALNMLELNNTINAGVRFLDNVATMSEFPLEEIEERVTNLRKIGLGVMGWAQLLYQCDIEYGSGISIKFGNKLMKHIDKQATEASHALAIERGSFANWEDSKYANPMEHQEWFKAHVHKEPQVYAKGYSIRNHNVTTVAPTGTTSMIGDTSGGIEPVYNVAYQKHVGDDIGKLVEFDSYFEDALRANEIDVDAVRAEASEKMNSGSYNTPHDLSAVPDALADKFVMTGDVSPEGHTMMQRAFQEAVDSGISKTINLPQHATRDDVADAYALALDQDEFGAPTKGLTVYRDQSREKQVMTTQKHSDKELENAKAKLEESGYTVQEE